MTQKEFDDWLFTILHCLILVTLIIAIIGLSVALWRML